jgi:hypothetical protein
MSDYLEPDVFAISERKARKEHKCCECFYKIQPGEKYTYFFGVWGGQPGDYKVCSACQWLRKLIDLHPCDDIYTQLWDNVHGIEEGLKPRMVRAKLLRDAGWSWRKLEEHFFSNQVTIRQWVDKIEKFERKMKK